MEKGPDHGFVHMSASGRGGVGLGAASQWGMGNKQQEGVVIYEVPTAGWMLCSFPRQGCKNTMPFTLGSLKVQTERASCPKSPSQEVAELPCEPKDI